MDAALSPRPPLQARSRRTLARMVDAGLELLAEGGPENVTIQNVVARARTSVGSFYARFAGRDELLKHLNSEAATRERERWEREFLRLSGEPNLEGRLRALVAQLVSRERDRPGSPGSAVAEAGARVLLECRSEIGHPDPVAAVELGFAAVGGAARHRPSGWSDARLSEELVRMWLAYLGQPSGRSDAEGVDFFHVW